MIFNHFVCNDVYSELMTGSRSMLRLYIREPNIFMISSTFRKWMSKAFVGILTEMIKMSLHV